MGSHPNNLILRFLLEIAALFAVGWWGWRQSDSWTRILWAVGLPLVMAVIWGTFAVPEDPSRSGNAPVVTPGIIRLVIELAFFGLATWTLYDLRMTRASMLFGLVVLIHYGLSYDRISWLLSQ